jgi:trigger factor
MDVTVEPIGPCRKRVTVKIPPEKVGEVYDKKYDEINRQVPVPGFRPGHAPRKLLEKRFGEKLGDDVKQDLVQEAIEEVLKGKEVRPLSPPEVDLEALALAPGAALEFAFEVVTRPDFETPKIEGLEVRVPPLEATDEEIDGFVDSLRRGDAKLEVVEGATVEDGDVLVVDWEARDGDSVVDRDANAYYRFGKGVVAGFVAEGLDEQLRGKGVDAEARARVHVAADDPRVELRGRELDLVVTLKQVRRYALPPLDAKFLEKHDYDDEADLREDMRKRILRAKGRGRDLDAERRLVEQLLDAVEISLPDGFVDSEVENWVQRKRLTLQMEKVDEEDIEKQVAANVEETRGAIERDMRRFFLLERVAEEQGIEATEADLAAAIQEVAEAYGHPFEQVLASFREPSRLAQLRSEIRQRKAREWIRSQANLVEDPALLPKPDTKKKSRP